MTPQVMCEHCRHVFAVPEGPPETVTCPTCGHSGAPAGIMRPTGFPSLETFKRSWQQVRSQSEERES